MESHTCCALVASVWICPWTTWVPDTGWAKRIYCSWPAFNWTWRQVEGRAGKENANRSLCTHPEHTAKKNSPARFRRTSRSYGGVLVRQLRGIPKGSRQESPRGTPKGKPEVTELLDIPVAPHSCFFFQAGKGSVSS